MEKVKCSIHDDAHCHDKDDKCIKLIRDCTDHWIECGRYGCDFGMHDDCMCQER